ncbi:phage tail protein [Providencia sp. PROV179]|uniref:phage tail protein n=1 Tax=Providencia sp. PROV179 TaxID=2949882 RepID=UPI000F49478F|nr:phage tail protein [Providencia sp. PROV179]
MKYFALLTKLGENLLAQATALGTKLELTHMAVGDGGGSLPTPDTNQTKLIAEKRRAAINTLFIDDKNKNQIIAEQIIPEQDGGWWIREIGLFDKAGNLIAVANCPETYKPQLAEGSGRTQSIRMVLIVSHTESVTLKIDPSVVLATREYVNTEITVLDKKIDALSAQTKLDLNKKFDKANISGQKGNDNDKVPSLNLFSTEIGKLAALGYSYSKIESDGRYQPKGNYAPAGDYATNAALTNGLNGKFDKTSIVQSTGSSTTNAMSQDATTKELNKKLNITGGNIKGGIVVESTSVSILSPNDYGGFTIHRNSGGHVRIETLPAGSTSMLTIANRNSTGGNINVAYVPNKSGHLAMADDVSLSAVPIGGSIIWNTSAPIPANYWANEGRSFSGTEYPEAAKVFTNLKLPDDRGYGIRVADNGRGIDAGRTVGTYQDDAVQNMTGNIVISSEVTPSGSANGVFSLTKKSGYTVTSEFFTRPAHEISLDISRQVRTSSETRMKNVSKILITRMK